MTAETYRGFDRDAYTLLAVSAVRRLWPMPGDWMRANARREFGRGVASRWFQ